MNFVRSFGWRRFFEQTHGQPRPGKPELLVKVPQASRPGKGLVEMGQELGHRRVAQVKGFPEGQVLLDLGQPFRLSELT